MHSPRPPEAHRRILDDTPALRLDLNGFPSLVAKIKINAFPVRGDTDIHLALRPIKLSFRFEHSEGVLHSFSTWRSLELLIERPRKPIVEALALDRPHLSMLANDQRRERFQFRRVEQIGVRGALDE